MAFDASGEDTSKSRSVPEPQRYSGGNGSLDRRYRRAGDLRTVQLLLGRSKIASAVGYQRINGEDAIEIAEKIDIWVNDAPPPKPDLFGDAPWVADRAERDGRYWDAAVMRPEFLDLAKLEEHQQAPYLGPHF